MITWTTTRTGPATQITHRLLHEWQVRDGGTGMSSAQAEDVTAWLRAAPEAVQDEVLGAFLTRVPGADVVDAAREPERTLRCDAIREALHKAWGMGYTTAVKRCFGDHVNVTVDESFHPKTAYYTDALLPAEFR